MNIEDKIAKIREHGPTRVLVHANGLAVRRWKAEQVYGILPSVVYVREDGWSLGAPVELERAAYDLYAEKWVARIDVVTGEWTYMF